ncbi:MAG: 3-phosphoshikimate 1-carboxyvinyltransferase [Candidatus Omnitrophica bacterium]|nr:3-phosphoshikimate 1-carboxyvinyltransferase [Candidatus Omnitrophota bacterium]MDD5593041.1 3-phosphoshikimate 1-carboxyvinyltransferase [Candidatus Omnitrophota bacterium]
MKFFLVKPALRLRGKIVLLGDKSIACRSIIISAISNGKTVIKNFPANKDCLYALRALRKLGVRIKEDAKDKNAGRVTVFGKGLEGLKKPKGPIFIGDSGTTLRLTLGILAGQNFSVTLTAGRGLSQRPMLRVSAPLRMMGAEISARRIPNTQHPTPNTKFEEYPPIRIKGGDIQPITYKMPLASAQVKSAILLAGLYAKGVTRVIENVKTRDHTERMLRLFRAGIKVKQNTIVIKERRELVSPAEIFIPGDISSASFFIVSAALVPGSEVLIKNVGLNPTRTGVIKVLKRMGAKIQVPGARCQVPGFEPMGNLIVKSSQLKGTIVKEKEIPSLIDELPILMVAACYARGKTVFEGVGELRVKETDRIRSMSANLIKMGARIRVIKKDKSEDLIVYGVRELKGASVKSYADHRTAMSMVVAALRARGVTRIDDVACINKSFPNFLTLLKALLH